MNKYIIVNNEAGGAVADAFSDLANYIDVRNKSDGECAEIAQQFAQELGDSSGVPAQTQKYFTQLVEKSHALISSPPAEFEAVLNLFWFVLSSAPNFNELIPQALTNLTTPVPTVQGQRIALLAVLGNLFNIVEGSQSKVLVFKKIVDLAVLSQSCNQFVKQFDEIAEWFKEWQSPETESLVLEIVGGVQLHQLEVLKFLKQVAVNFPKITSIAQKLVDMTLTVNGAFDVLPLNQLLQLQAVKNLETADSERYTLVKCVCEGDYKTFQTLKFKDNAKLAKQARTLAISRLASNSTTRELKYAEIGEVLQLKENFEIEAAVVDAAKTGVVTGRLNQLNQTFQLESASLVGPVNDQHWDVIEERLQNWKKSLSAIYELSAKAKNHRDLVKQLNKLEVR